MSNIKGSCHCGRVKWEFNHPINTVVRCYCGMCRKLQGSDYSSWVVVPENQFAIVTGKENISKYQVTEVSHKSFCQTCGTTVNCLNGKRFPNHVVIARGTIDTGTDIDTRIQVFTQHKADWVTIHEDVPVFN